MFIHVSNNKTPCIRIPSPKHPCKRHPQARSQERACYRLIVAWAPRQISGKEKIALSSPASLRTDIDELCAGFSSGGYGRDGEEARNLWSPSFRQPTDVHSPTMQDGHLSVLIQS
jgi:hypothetical protein